MKFFLADLDLLQLDVIRSSLEKYPLVIVTNLYYELICIVQSNCYSDVQQSVDTVQPELREDSSLP